MANAGSSPAELQKAIDAGIKPQSRPLPDTSVTFHLRNLFSHPGTTYNVGCLLEGSDPALVHETLIISGHLDHDGMSRADTWHGADDNGSGTVAVVDLAHAFAANPTKPKRSVLFVVFAAEERGLLGAYYLAAHPICPLATTLAMINFDMLGCLDDRFDHESALNIFFRSDQFPFVLHSCLPCGGSPASIPTITTPLTRGRQN